ncbi:MAG: citramalate synthase [Deferribacteres bacterium]|nr:citramalate synthase [candidate division KSB1 bacterium]MCB9500302.1 citramalate synthase [Deferribacteres bacterium]
MKIQTFDTTLRDGTQGEKVSFSVDEKLRIARKLDEFGFDYIEGGWPGSNPKDALFFDGAKKIDWQHAKICAFGSTRRSGVSAKKDGNLNMLLAAETPTVTIFGKTWIKHLEKALLVTREENDAMITESVAWLKENGREVIYDAEHFFDGYKSDPEYAMQTLRAAQQGGADILTLCDTNGGTLPHEISEIVAHVRKNIDGVLGIHAHNDSELAVANSIAAVVAGARHVQGTINGFGERCGNANILSVIANLQLKLKFQCLDPQALKHLTELSNFVFELANLAPRDEAAFIGRSAFAHKGGVHVSAVMKDPTTYEHINPEAVGNRRRVLVSDLSGRSNVKYKMSELDLADGDAAETGKIVQEIKKLENEGYHFEAAEASFELLVQRNRELVPAFFDLQGFRISVERDSHHVIPRSEASIRVIVDGHVEHTAAEGDGPVNALDNALRKALLRFYPDVALMHLIDYKVRVLSEDDGTAAKVRVLIESQCGNDCWTTIGVSENIIEASWEALVDSFTFFLYKKHPSQVQNGKKEKSISVA